MLLSDLGFANGPKGFSILRGAVVHERIDSGNNVTLVFTSPSGVEIADYLRENLTSMGFAITADKANSLLFEDATWDGAFTSSSTLTALSLRTDRG